MDERAYDSEDLLQHLLAKHPDLLAGDQIDDTDPRRWLLVQRELGVPDREDGASRWSVDHLFLDQDGVPTLVEVKRSSDTPFSLYEAGNDTIVHLMFAEMGPAFSELEQRVELCDRVNRIKGVRISPRKQYPGFGFAKLRTESAIEKLLEALGWVVGRMRAAGAGE